MLNYQVGWQENRPAALDSTTVSSSISDFVHPDQLKKEDAHPFPTVLKLSYGLSEVELPGRLSLELFEGLMEEVYLLGSAPSVDGPAIGAVQRCSSDRSWSFLGGLQKLQRKEYTDIAGLCITYAAAPHSRIPWARGTLFVILQTLLLS